MQQTGIDLAGTVEAARPNEAPDDGGRICRASVRAGEVVGLILRADFINVAKHPGRDADLRQSTEDSCAALREEDHPRRDFVIVTELHILGKE